MDLSRFKRRSEHEWEIEPHRAMRVPGVISATESLVRAMDDKVYEQVVNVAALPGIVKASYAMPDAHWGYGFPIGGVAAFDPEEGGIVSAGGVGYDISCCVRSLHTGLSARQVRAVQERLPGCPLPRNPAGPRGHRVVWARGSRVGGGNAGGVGRHGFDSARCFRDGRDAHGRCALGGEARLWRGR